MLIHHLVRAIRDGLKENNLRIRALDTSSTASFPSRDWQITFNDSANGGANRFTIDDIDGGLTPFTIEASAPSNSLYVDTDGDVGLGTDSPDAKLDVVGDVSVKGAIAVTGFSINADPLRYTWFLGDTAGSDLTLSPVKRSDGDPAGREVFFLTTGGDLTINGNLSQGSDVNSKTNIRAINADDVLMRLRGLQIFEWQYRSDEDDVQHMGPMAQDFFAVFGVGRDERHISTLDTSGVALAAIQALLIKVESKESEIDQLRQSNADHSDRLRQLEEAVSSLK